MERWRTASSWRSATFSRAMAVDPKSNAQRNVERANSGIMVARGLEVASVPRLYAGEGSVA